MYLRLPAGHAKKQVKFLRSACYSMSSRQCLQQGTKLDYLLDPSPHVTGQVDYGKTADAFHNVVAWQESGKKKH
jgi:hypothetical protein